VVGGLLPTSGRTRWSVRIDETDEGAIYVGVVAVAANYGWGFNPETGRIGNRLLTSFASGTISCQRSLLQPLPEGFPAVEEAMADLQPPLQACGSRDVVHVTVDHDAGTLSFALNGGAPSLAVTGFPKGAALRPWVRIRDRVDRVSLQPGWWSSS